MSAGEIALAVQTARGSIAASSTQRSNVIGLTLGPTTGLNPNPELRNVRISGAPWVPAVGAAGDVEIVIRPKIAGLLLYAALGTKAVSGSSDPWTHTFTQSTAVLPYLTAWRHLFGFENDRFADLRVQRLVIQSTSGRPVTMRATLVGGLAAFRTAQETTAAVESADYLEHRHGASALLVEGSAFSAISDWTLTIDTGVALEQGLSGPIARMNGMPRIGLDITHIVPDASLWRRMVYGSASPANLAPPATTPLTLAGSPVGVQFTLTEQPSPARSLQIAIPQVALGPIGGFEPDTGYGPVTIRTSLLAYQPSSGSPITAVLKNSQSSY